MKRFIAFIIHEDLLNVIHLMNGWVCTFLLPVLFIKAYAQDEYNADEIISWGYINLWRAVFTQTKTPRYRDAEN